jgi:hypothetical protein
VDRPTLNRSPLGFSRTRVKWAVLFATVAVFCLLGTLLDPFRWGLFRRPTYAEKAAEFRAESAEWERLAAENPVRAKEFRKTAEEARETADRLERRAAKGAAR